MGDPGRQGRQAGQASEVRARVGAFLAEGPVRAKNKARLERYDQMEAGGAQLQEARLLRDPDSAGAASGRRRCLEAKHIHKAFGDRVLIDDLSFTLPRNGIVGRDRPERRRQVHAVQDDRRPGTAHLGRADRGRHRQDQLRGPEPRGDSTRRRTCGRRSPDGLDFIEVGGVGGADPRLRGQLRLQGFRPAEADRRTLRRRAQPA